MVTGGSLPIHVGRDANRPPRKGLLAPRFRLDYIPEPADPKGLLALALYREALNVNSNPYKFLGFSKILNVVHRSGPKQVDWINKTVDHLEDHQAGARLAELRENGVKDVGGVGPVRRGPCLR